MARTCSSVVLHREGFFMSQICELTGKRPLYGNTVSHAKNRRRTRWELNLKDKSYWISSLGCSMYLRLSTRAIRTIDKFGGITEAIMKVKEKDLSPRLKRIRRAIYKKRIRHCLPNKQ